MKAYDHKAIEQKWQEAWASAKIYETKDSVAGKDNFYLLVEFPYPSGNLHVGHWYSFAVPDILARKLRMEGKNVLYPIGFDAFGLPAENAAIKNKVNPRDWTYSNIDYMRGQVRSMGASFDWSREVIACDPNYYKWTQWLFLQLYKSNLVYRKETMVNWCPNDKTVLANEQVIDGKCERCGHDVIQKEMLQWNIKITEFADRLVDDLEKLDWPEPIKESQRNWIGRSGGAEIDFYLDFGDETVNDRVGPDGKKAHITVFTTRPDTLFGATYLVLAPEHPWVTLALQHKTVLKNSDEVAAYVEQASKKTELERQRETKEKTGVQLKGVEAINPATGARVPLYIADYVLAGYGTGAIMAVPAHDGRDYEFAKKFNLPIKDVVEMLDIRADGPDTVRKDLEFEERTAIMAVVKHWERDEYLCLKWKLLPVRAWVTGGIEKGEGPLEAAKREIREETGYLNAEFVQPLGGRVHSQFFSMDKKVNRFAHFTPLLFKLKDGSREEVSQEEKALQDIQWVPASEVGHFINRPDMLMIWERVKNKSTLYTGSGILANSGEFDGLTTEQAKKKITEKFGRRKTTYRLRDWIVSRQRYWGAPIPMIHCPKCGIVPVPEDQLPVLLPETDDYLPDGKGKSPLAKVDSFVHVKCPQCGGDAERETDTFDTFVDSSWYFLRYTDPKNESEFAAKDKQANWMPIDLYSGGAEHTTMHLLYSRFWHKALFDRGLVADSEPYVRRMNRGIILGPDGQKMSKSKGNVIDPDDVVNRLGADTVRMYLAFIGPYNEVASYPWNPDSVVGVRRFLERVWRAQEFIVKSSELDEKRYKLVDATLHLSIKRVGEDIVRLKFNTAISQLMILLNFIEGEKQLSKEQWDTLLKLLAPFAPHITEELWHETGHDTSVHLERWPTFDPKLLQGKDVIMAIQIDGKTRDEITVASGVSEDDIEKAARGKVANRLEGKTIVRTVVVPKRLVNFVTS